MTDIAAFLAARLDEDKAIARHVIFNSKGRDRWQVGAVTYREDYAFASIHTPDGLEIAGAGFDGTGGIHGDVFATHIARHDPARVLRDVAAKRAIVDRCRRVAEGLAQVSHKAVATASTPAERQYRQAGQDLLSTNTAALLLAVKLLAGVYADHQDFDPAWRIGA